MPEGKEKLCAECASVTDGLRVEQLTIFAFQPFTWGRELVRELLANTS